jgi:ribosomal protein L21E
MAVDDASHGSTTPAVAPHTYNQGTVVEITATPTPAALWRFDHWSGDVGTVTDVNDPTTTVIMNGDYTITANFVAITTPGENSYWVYNVDYVYAAKTIDDHTVWTLTVIDEVAAGTVLWSGTDAEYTLTDDCYLVDYSFSANPVRFSQIKLTFTDAKQWFSTDLLWERAKEMLTSAYRPTVRHTYTGDPGSPLSDGKTWTDASNAITVSVSSGGEVANTTTTYSVVVSSEQVTVPAGIFTCFKIVYTNTANSQVAQTDWWSPQVLGLVKSWNLSYEVQETWELTYYSLV